MPVDVMNNIRKRVSKRNFDNDVINTLDKLIHYRLTMEPISIGSSTYDGALLEFIIAMVEEMQELQNKIEKLGGNVTITEDVPDLVPELLRRVSEVEAGIEKLNTASVTSVWTTDGPCNCSPDESVACTTPGCKGGSNLNGDGAMQTKIDGSEEPHAKVAEKANPKKPGAKKAGGR